MSHDRRYRHIIRATAFVLLAYAAYAGPTAPGLPDHEFSFAVLGDRSPDDPTRYDEMIQALVQLSPSFAIQVGDIIDHRSGIIAEIEAGRERWYPQIHPLKIPFYGVFSYHDLEALGTPGQAAFERYHRRALHWSFDYRNAHFVFLNTDDVTSLEPAGQQLEWLRQDLSATDAEHLFAFMHRPAGSRRGQDELDKLFAHREVDVVFIGHGLPGQAVEPGRSVPYVNMRETEAAHGSSAAVAWVAVRDNRYRLSALEAGAVEPVALPETAQEAARRRATRERRLSEFERGCADFELARIVSIFRQPGAETRYGIDQGKEANIFQGSRLQVYRVDADGPADKAQRRLIGWLQIELSEVDAGAVGTFVPLSKRIAEKDGEPMLPASGDLAAPVLSEPADLLFTAGMADLTPEGIAELRKVANFVRNFCPDRLIVASHAHSQANPKTNQRLSEARANAVRAHLTDTYDFVSPDLIEVRGYGDWGPESFAGDERERIEFIVWER